MSTRSRDKSISHLFLKATGLGYFPELTQDVNGKVTIEVPNRMLNGPPGKSTIELLQESEEDDFDRQATEVAELGIKEKPPASPATLTPTILTPNPENEFVADNRPQILVSESDATLALHIPHGPSSESSSTLSDITSVPLAEFVSSNCPHIARSFFIKPLILPSWSIQEAAGYSGWFTKKIKNDLEWERIYLRIPERHVPGPDPGYGTISIDITPPLSVPLPSSRATIIYAGGILTPKDHNITRWHIDELADPSGPHKMRVVFVNLRGQHGNPMTSARLFDPHYDSEDFAVIVDYLHSLFPQSPLIGHSFSFGGPVITRYMAQLGDKCPLHAAVIFAPCFNLARGLRRFHENKVVRPGSIYSANQIRKMCESAEEKFAAAGYPVDKIPTPKGPWVADLYDVLMPYLTGWSYPEFTESLIRDLEVGIPKITVPTFYIGSYKDDSTGSEARLHAAVKQNPNIIRLMSQSRAHLGYYSGLFKPKRWAQKPMFEFIAAMATVPLRKDNGFVWNKYFDGVEIQYTALAEKDNPEAKPRHHRAIDIRKAA